MNEEKSEKVKSVGIEKAITTARRLAEKVKRPILIAVDGRSGTGKSTIAQKIADELGGVKITADDFWVGGSNEEWDTRTPKEKVDMAIDWNRIRQEVLVPLLNNEPATWHPFNWETGEVLSSKSIHSESNPYIILDGAYSARPELEDIIDISILINVKDSLRRLRLKEREGEPYMQDWHTRWDVAEDYYFSHHRPQESFDITIEND